MDVLRQAESRWQLAGWLLAAAFPVLALVLDKAGSTIYAIFFLAGLWLLLARRFDSPDPAVRPVLAAFGLYFVVAILSFAFGEQTRLGEKLLGRDIRFLGAIPVFFVLARMALPERLLRMSFVAGGVVTGVVAVVEVLLADSPDHRASGQTISIVFGHLSVMLFAINLALAVFERRGRGMATAATVFSLVAVVLSGTRGALLSVLAVLAVAVAFILWRGVSRERLGRVFAAALVAVALIAAGASWLYPRFEEGWRDYQAYLRAPQESGVARGCIGEPETLQRLLEASRLHRLEARVVQNGVGECGAESAIELVNPSGKTGRWIGPYRHLPVGAKGAMVVRGKASIEVAGSERRKVASSEGLRVEVPAVEDIERPEIHVRLAPRSRVLVVPVEMHAGEYAFASAETSIGNRLMMWSMTVRRLEPDLLGRGPGTWPEVASEEAAEGRVAWRLVAYDHAHNDYLTVLLERGWLGLVALLGIFVAPLAWAAREGRQAEWRGGAVLLMITAAAASALTETVFNHSISITYYCSLVLLLLAARPRSSAR